MDHYGKEPIPEDLCDALWRILEYILKELGYDTSDLQKYRSLKFIMEGSTRTAAIQAVLSFMLLQDVPTLSFDGISQSSTSVTRRTKLHSLKGLFFELVGALSLEELKFYFDDLRKIKTKLFPKKNEVVPEDLSGVTEDPCFANEGKSNFSTRLLMNKSYSYNRSSYELVSG